jgi:cation diffusion facilitator CzcD-associated flavoprotein CzcO
MTDIITTPIESTELDLESLRAKALIERDKRLRGDGVDQFQRLDDIDYDPHTPLQEREPLTDHVTFTFIGGGFSGLLAGARLKEAGIDDVRILDRGGDFGGVWYWNRYPGAMCDTASIVYLPLLEETGYVPTEKYAHGPEIFAHAQRIGRHYGLYENALFHTRVTKVEWNEDESVWTVSTNRGDRFTTKYLGMGVGPLTIPKLPKIPGIESFAGEQFHTSRWNYEFTGGDPSGAPLDKLAGKRVAVIGTGATAIQAVPELAKSDAEVFVVQRTPSGVDFRGNAPIEQEWFDSIAEPGWQEKWFDNFVNAHFPPAGPITGPDPEDFVQDGWTEIGKHWRDHIREIPPEEYSMERFGAAMNKANYAKMALIRDRVDKVVDDPDVAEPLKPWYRLFCKRPGFHDEYLAAFNRPNVHLVDTDGKGVEAVTETGIIVNGEELPVDLIVFASGFEFGTSLQDRFGYEVIGRDGQSVYDAWKSGMRTLFGMFAHGYPNLFLVQQVHGAGFGPNFVQEAYESARTLTAVIEAAERQGASSVEATEAAESAYIDTLMQFGGAGVFFDPECTPGYYNKEGSIPSQEDAQNLAFYPFGPAAFFTMIRDWRSADELDGLQFS